VISSIINLLGASGVVDTFIFDISTERISLYPEGSFIFNFSLYLSYCSTNIFLSSSSLSNSFTFIPFLVAISDRLPI